MRQQFWLILLCSIEHRKILMVYRNTKKKFWIFKENKLLYLILLYPVTNVAIFDSLISCKLKEMRWPVNYLKGLKFVLHLRMIDFNCKRLCNIAKFNITSLPLTCKINNTLNGAERLTNTLTWNLRWPNNILFSLLR